MTSVKTEYRKMEILAVDTPFCQKDAYDTPIIIIIAAFRILERPIGSNGEGLAKQDFTK